MIFHRHRWGGENTQYEVPGGYAVEGGARMEGTLTFEMCLDCDVAKVACVSMGRVPAPSDVLPGGE